MIADQHTVADSGALVEYGVSDELLGLFDALRETPGLAGDKFRKEDVNALAQSILCRNYGKACLELGHLLWAIMLNQKVKPAHRHSPLLDFFWLSESISPKRVRQAFASSVSVANHQLCLDNAALQLHVGADVFAISPTRVGYLAVLFEFLVNIDPQVIELAERQLDGGDVSVGLSAIKAFSSAMQKKIYDHLSKHTAPAQQQRRFRHVSTWLKNHVSGKTLKDTINDDMVLAFWQQAALSSDDQMSFKQYRTVANDFIGMLQAAALVSAKRQAQHASTIGHDVEGGEVHPEHLDDWLTTLDDDVNYSWLCGSPKFLKQPQLNVLKPIMLCQDVLTKLPLTVMRMAVFGDWQAEIVQASRGKKPEVLIAKLNKTVESDYQQYLHTLVQLLAVLKDVLKALLHIFAEGKNETLLHALAQLMNNADWQQVNQVLLNIQDKLNLAPDDEQTKRLVFADFIAQLASLRLQYMGLNQLLQQAKKAYTANNRQGFKSIPAAQEMADYEYGFDTIVRCHRVISGYHGDLSVFFATEHPLDENFSADLVIFRDMFKKIHEVVYES